MMKTLLKEFNALQSADSSDAGSSDTQGKGAEVKFDLMRNTINSDGQVKGSHVADYLERAHELNDEVETVLYGLETSDGDIVKVYVNAQDADKFEEEMKKMLGMQDDIEEAIENLATKFDIVDVIWPQNKQGGEDEEDDLNLDGGVGDPALDDEDDDMEEVASLDDESADAAAADDTAGDEEAPASEEPKKEKKHKKEKGEGEEEAPSDEENSEEMPPPPEEGEEEAPSDEEPAPEEEPEEGKGKEDKKKEKHSLLKSIGGGLAKKKEVKEGKDADADLTREIKQALENGDDYTAKKLAKMASTPEKVKELQKLISDEMHRVSEGEVIHAKFGKGVDNPDVEVPKGYDRFEVDGKKIIGIKGDKKSVVSSTSDERLAQELVRIYNGGKASTTLKPISLLRAFGSEELAAAEDEGIKLTEKPSYWEDFEGDGYAAKNNFNDLKLKKLEKTIGKLTVYSGKDLYGSDTKPSGPLKTVKTMPKENMFIVKFDDGSRYVADQTGARTYIRFWQKIN